MNLDSNRHCVSCGRKMLDRNHHCSARHERARAAAARTTYRAPPRRTFTQRLADGVAMLAMRGDRDVDIICEDE